MPHDFKAKLTRREWFSASILASGALLFGFGRFAWPQSVPSLGKDSFAGGKALGAVGFVGEGQLRMDTLLGTELDGRLYTDLSTLTPTDPITLTEKFYVRTRASQLLDHQNPWSIRFGSHAQPTSLALEDLRRDTKPLGLHLMECAGNTREGHFGLISVADWTGVPLSKLLDAAQIGGRGTRVLVSGFDTYATRSVSSIPGASWIFSLDELRTSGAFLATEMNGQSLTRDRGAPVRLVVPGWYGCACIKWVNEITLVNDTAEVTSQMQEFAMRTHQRGVPKLARDYEPATMDQAAMPIRVEKWLVGERIKYRVVGILWGGSRLVKALGIRFNPEEDYVPVDYFHQTGNDPWSFWTHSWAPQKPGRYMIRLRVVDPPIQTRRLDLGFYLRTVEIRDV